MGDGARKQVAKEAVGRPLPPDYLLAPLAADAVVPALDMWAWAMSTFVHRDSPLFNPEHVHLEAANVGVLWTNVANGRHMRRVVGQAEVPQTNGGKWQRARSSQQLREWFGTDGLDFLITLDATASAEMDDASFCALIEHEMYHCGHARNEFGVPKFSRSGRPSFALRGHDVEEFVGVVRRYGAASAAGGVQEMVRAAGRSPEVAAAAVAAVCGTCGAGV